MEHSHNLILALVAALGTTMGTAVRAQQPKPAPEPPAGSAIAPAPMESKALDILKAACKVLAAWLAPAYGA